MQALSSIDKLLSSRYINKEQYISFNSGVVQTALFLYIEESGKIIIYRISCKEYGAEVEYISLKKSPYYTDSLPLVEGLGYSLVELLVVKKTDHFQVKAVISGSGSVGIKDCSKVHRVLLPRLEAILQSQDIYMEVTSPGTERQIKNGAEFPLFIGRYIRVWDTRIREWISGKLCSADENGISLEPADPGQDVPQQITVPFEFAAKAKLFNA